MAVGKLTFREATFEDKPALKMLALPHERDMDVTLGRYEDFLRNEFRFQFVAESEGRVVSHVGLKVLDAGKSVYYYGAKTHEDFRNRGIQTQLLAHALSKVKEKFPMLERVNFNTVWRAYDDQYFRESTRKRLLNRQKMICAVITTNDFANKILPKWRPMLKQSSLIEVRPGNFCSEVFGKVDFEANFCQIEHHFFRPVAENEEIVHEMLEKAYIDSDKMSFSTFCSKPRCEGFFLMNRYDIDITCKSTGEGIQHMLRHLEDIVKKECETKSERFELYVRLCRKMDFEEVYGMFFNKETETAIAISPYCSEEFWNNKLIDFPGAFYPNQEFTE